MNSARPARVDRYIKALQRAGRFTEAAALMRIEWRQPSAFEVYMDKLKEAFDEMAKVVCFAVAPALDDLNHAIIGMWK